MKAPPFRAYRWMLLASTLAASVGAIALASRGADNASRAVFLPPSSYPVSPPAPSPTGTHFFAFGSIDGLWIGAFGDRAVRRLPGRLAVQGFGYSDVPPFRWSSNGREVLGVRQPTLDPSGFATGPMTPIAISLSGQVRPLPGLSHPAGALDGLYWIDGSGLAVAEFGTKGGYYKPERADPNPTLAIVDAMRGQVIEARILKSLGLTRDDARPGAIDAVRNRAGAHVVLRFGKDEWNEWRQGTPGRKLPFTDKRPSRHFAISADGRALLSMTGLSATGVICERDPRCPPPTPQSGAVAQLRDLATGRTLWVLNGMAKDFSPTFKPAVSKDGRHALIGLPADGTANTTIALVSMRTGAIIRRLAVPWSSGISFGFGSTPGEAWISGQHEVRFYTL